MCDRITVLPHRMKQIRCAMATLRRILPLAVLPFLLAADWPGHHGPTRDGQSTETKLVWDWPEGGPPVAWKIPVGSGFAGVAVAEGKVFLFHRIEDQEILAALDPATGKELWKFAYATKYRDDFQFDNGPRCAPLIADGVAYLNGADGDLHAVETKAGKALWGKNLLAEYKPKKGYFGVGAGPLLVAGKLLVNVGAKGAGIAAFDPETGKELWKSSDDGPSYSAPATMDLGGKPHAVFFTRAGLLVVNPADGKVALSHPWRARIDASVNAATPLILGEEILLTTSYSTGAILLKPKGTEVEELWSTDKAISAQYNTPVRVGEFVYGIDGRQEGKAARLRCIDWKTGKVRWTREKFGLASLIAVDGGLLAVNEDGEAIRFDASSEKYVERGRAQLLTGVVRAAPALSDGLLFVRNEKELIAVKLK